MKYILPPTILYVYNSPVLTSYREGNKEVKQRRLRAITLHRAIEKRQILVDFSSITT